MLVPRSSNAARYFTRSDTLKTQPGASTEAISVFEITLRKIGEICRSSALGELKPDEARSVLLEFRALNNKLDTIGRLFALTPMRPDTKKAASYDASVYR